MKRFFLGIVFVLVQVGCALSGTSTAVVPTLTLPPVTATLPPTEIPTAVTNTMAKTPTSLPTRTLTTTPTSTRTAVPSTRTPTVRPSPSATPSPSPIPGPAQVCDSLAARGTVGIFVVDIQPDPPLVWDAHPHFFRVGVCNTLPPSAVPQGKYKMFLYFPASSQGREQSTAIPAELKPGMNVVTVGPWVPGLENHLATCAPKSTAEVEVTYDDSPDPIFRVLPWPDGKTRGYLPVQCGGTYP